MIKKAWDLFNEADAVIGYNSKNFDCKILNKEFILSGFPPPAPYKHIDLLQTMKNKFKIVSHGSSTNVSPITCVTCPSITLELGG